MPQEGGLVGGEGWINGTREGEGIKVKGADKEYL